MCLACVRSFNSRQYNEDKSFHRQDILCLLITLSSDLVQNPGTLKSEKNLTLANIQYTPLFFLCVLKNRKEKPNCNIIKRISNRIIPCFMLRIRSIYSVLIILRQNIQRHYLDSITTHAHTIIQVTVNN